MTLKRDNFTAKHADVAVEALEPVLQSKLLDMLKCSNSSSNKLASGLGIVGMDSLPDDLREESKNSESRQQDHRVTHLFLSFSHTFTF